MAELGLIAAVVQVADVGLRLSDKIYTFGQTVASADESILFISKDIRHTCSILRTIEHNLKKDCEAELYSRNAVSTADTIVKECLAIFQEMDRALSRKITRIGLDGSSSRVAVTALERLRWPFLKPKMMLMWSNLDKLKSSLHLMLNVFIYARLLVERNEEVSVVSDQGSMIEHLLRTTEEQSRKYESLQAAIGCKENINGNQDATHGCKASRPDMDAGTMPGEVPNKSRTKDVLEAPKADCMTTEVESYYTLVEHLMAEIEAEKYNIEPDVRRRIRDDVIRTHEREIWLLRALHEHPESSEKMREKPWRLLEIAEDMADKGKHQRVEKCGQSSSGAKPGPFPLDLGAQSLDPDPRCSSYGIETQRQMKDNESSSTKARTTAMNQTPAPTINAIGLFLDNREDPWNHLHLLIDAPLIDQPRVAEENGWLPYWRSGASTHAFHRILPLNALNAPLQFLRSCTSMLGTEASHTVETVASSQDLAALTDSTDTDTYVSARSEVGDTLSDAYPICLEEGEKDGPLMINDDQGYLDEVRKDDWRLGVTNFDTSLDDFQES